MATRDKGPAGFELSRRAFVKASAAAAAAGAAGVDWIARTEPALGAVGDVAYTTFNTTCPYCSASCGQQVAVATAASAARGIAIGDVIDIWGDSASPINQGGLCAKGAGALQLVNNTRRLGVSTNPNALSGAAYKRTGNGAWNAITVDTAMSEIASGFVSARGAIALDASGTINGARPNGTDEGVMFFGCSHANNEQNYLYRKIVANFGTTNVEHQARI
ncbi:MAG: twin-arginine translocation signal domain-containing protein [Coriobacteriia bacterium]